MKSKVTICDVLRDLAAMIGPDVLSVPISAIPGSASSPRAWTTDDGICIRSDILEKRPQDVGKLIAHELWHHVIRDDTVRRRFNHVVVNYGEDYVINWQLWKLFAIDLRTVKGGCLFDEKLGVMPLAKTCRILTRQAKLDPALPTGSVGVSCPALLRVARRLRKKYAKIIGERATAFYADVIDEETFVSGAGPVIRALRFDNLSASPESALEFLWQRLYLQKPVATVNSKAELTTEQALAYCYPAADIRSKTVGNPDDAAIAAGMFLTLADNDPAWLKKKVLEATTRVCFQKRRLVLLTYLLNTQNKKSKKSRSPGKPKKKKVIKKVTREDINKAKARLASLSKKLDAWKALKPLPTLLAHSPVTVKARSDSSGERRPASLSATFRHDAQDEGKLPRIIGSETTKAIARVAKRADTAFDKIREALEAIARAGFPLDETTPAQPDQIPTVGEGHDPGENEGPGEGSSKDSEESAEGNGGESPDGRDGEGSEGEGKGKGGKRSNDAGKGAPANGAGKGEGVPSRTGVALILMLGFSSLERILTNMNEMTTALLNAKSRRSNEHSHAAATRYAYGSDLERVVPDSLALLDNPATKLSFLADLAAGSLPQRIPPDRKRFPVVICVDSSGSMVGRDYETAAGFALALISLLQRDRRGASLVMFSSSAYRRVDVMPGRALDIQRALEALMQPKVGGTDFDSPLHASFDIRDELQWKNVMTMVVTDGECHVRNKEAILARKRLDDRIVAVISNSRHANLSGLADNVYISKRNGMATELVEASRGVL